MEFERVYKEFNRKYPNWVGRLSRLYGIDIQDAQSIVDDSMLEMFERIKEIGIEGFNKLIHVTSRRRSIDLIRKLGKEREKTCDVMAISEDEGYFLEVYEVSETRKPYVIDDDLETIIKKRDQRQLISELMSKASDTARESVVAYLETNSYREASRIIGVNHETVKNRIRTLAKAYDYKKYGDIKEYFTVPTQAI